MSGSKPFKIVVVGGGIAGLAAAIGLRGPNRQIVVLERSAEHREIGAAISLQPNASKIVEKWGISSILEKKGATVDRGFRIYSPDGILRTTVPFSKDMFGADRMLYHRVDLLEGLKEAATSLDVPGLPVEIQLSSYAVSCACETGTVTLKDGSTVQGDLVVAADGIHSLLRQDVIGHDQQPVPTRLSAYRIIMPSELIEDIPETVKIINPQDPWTTMIFGHDRRIIMGPCRDGQMFSLVCLVPDEKMNEVSATDSWTSSGSKEHLLESFSDFPIWIKDKLKAAPSLGLWQLRDIDPLKTWHKGRCILIGDAAHAMLPLQGQGASQSMEDAEALQAMFSDVDGCPSKEEIENRLQEVFECRYERVSLIQKFSRQQAKPASNVEGNRITMDATEFMEYNCRYEGAKAWQAQQCGK
ncbi:related to salicylate 1-monooxygenase [Phialocephala subalpina]|uniref:Related to salicylate 1-monooxygenase n=1 Tax=Phialocephala subalpina TaxID=576137 RepID=A0A1L7WYF2_9HELO|nr:related to salicylate 1-monooxygenase [Phialocephala subalpina]